MEINGRDLENLSEESGNAFNLASDIFEPLIEDETDPKMKELLRIARRKAKDLGRSIEQIINYADTQGIEMEDN